MEVNSARVYDVAILGAGPAGSAAAITAARAGAKVILLEQSRFPRHKVCGEFISPESIGLLGGLLGKNHSLITDAPRVGRSRLYLDGREVELPVEPAAASIPRFLMDEALWKMAQASGVKCCDGTVVEKAERTGETFHVQTAGFTLSARAVINATGRWSRMPRTALQKAHATQREKWIGVKAHFEEENPSQTVDLYFFEGGYCGVAPVSAGRINACAMVKAEVASTLQQVFAQHEKLAARSAHWRIATEPVSTAPLIFAPVEPVEGGIFFAGDSAGFVDPFTGDGISLALRSGALAARSVERFFAGEQTLTESLADYRARHLKELRPIYRSAARFRKMLALPRIGRSVLLQALEIPAIGRWAVASTRGKS